MGSGNLAIAHRCETLFYKEIVMDLWTTYLVYLAISIALTVWVGRTLHALSIEGKWQGMLDQISDEILDAFSIVATYDELASKLKERWRGVCSTIFLGLSPQMLANESLVRGIVDELHRP